MWQMDLEAAKGDKRRQVKATNCGKFVAAFCRFLPLGFEPRSFRTISLGDGVCVQMKFPSASLRCHFLAAMNVWQLPSWDWCGRSLSVTVDGSWLVPGKISLNGILTHLFTDINLQWERDGINNECKWKQSNSLANNLDVHGCSSVHVHASLTLNAGDFFVIRV